MIKSVVSELAVIDPIIYSFIEYTFLSTYYVSAIVLDYGVQK